LKSGQGDKAFAILMILLANIAFTLDDGTWINWVYALLAIIVGCWWIDRFLD
jgi:hypothetical protein